MKELYYIRGSKTNPEEVKQTLLNKGGIIGSSFTFNDPNGLYYISKNGIIEYTANSNNQINRLLLEYGTELKPLELKEILKPFDKVIVRFDDNTEWFIDFFIRILDGKYFQCIGAIYDECHKYESWMDKYVDTDVSFEEFKKD